MADSGWIIEGGRTSAMPSLKCVIDFNMKPLVKGQRF